MYAARIDLLYESALLLAAVCFSLSLYVLSKGVGNKLNLAFSSLSLSISVWAFSFFMANVLQWRLMESVHILTTLVLPPLSLLFLNALLRPEAGMFRWMLRASFVISFLLIPPVAFGYDRTPWIRDLAYYSPSLIVVANLYLFLSETFWKVMPRGGWGDFSRLSSLEMRHSLKRRNFWIYLGGALVTMLCVMDRVSWMGRTVPSIGLLFLAFYFFFLRDVVLHQSLVRSRSIIGRFLANGAGAFVAFLSFILMTTWVQGNPTLYLINAFFAAFVAIWTLDPVRSLVSLLFQRFFLKEVGPIHSVIREVEKEIVGAFHGQAIAAATAKLLEKSLEAPMVAFYSLDPEGKQFRKLHDGLGDVLPEVLPASFPLAQHFSKAKNWVPALSSELEKSISRETISSKIAGLQLTLESLKSLQSTLAFPLVYERSILGFATVNLREPPEHWDESWGFLFLLQPYFTKAAQALRDLDIYARLRERDRLAALGEMAAGLAHEIRNPLGAIKGAAQLLETQDKNQEPFLKIIVEEVNRLNFVVTQFLNYAKPFQGESQWTDLKALVEKVGGEFAGRCASESLEFQVFVPTSMPLVKCQPSLIRLVLTNLLENGILALKSQRREQFPTLSLRLAHTIRDSQAEIRLSVEDNGPGMGPEILDKIFIPFFTQSAQGTGLGLSICQKIAEAHGGRMEASSVPGEGTWMTLRFSAQIKE